jgi:hypothetical protein
MSKGRYIFVCALATLSLVGVTMAHETPMMFKAEETPTSYSKSVTLLPSMLHNYVQNEDYTVTVGGLTLTLGGYVRNVGGYINIDTGEEMGSITWPHYVTTSGAHGVGYNNMRFGPSQDSTHELNMKIWNYDNGVGSSASYFPKTGTLLTDGPLDISIGGSHTYYSIVSIASYAGISCAFEYLTASYTCSSN